MEESGTVMLKCLKKSLSGYVPLSGFLYSVRQLIKHTPLPAELKSENNKWWNLYFPDKEGNQTALQFAVKMLEILFIGCSSQKPLRLSYAECLKEFFKV